MSFCEGQIANYKIPRHIRIVDESPITVIGKIQKFTICDQMIKELGLNQNPQQSYSFISREPSANSRARNYIGGISPFLPTATNLAVSLPPAVPDATTNVLAPLVAIDFPAGSNRTTGALDGTSTITFWPLP